MINFDKSNKIKVFRTGIKRITFKKCAYIKMTLICYPQCYVTFFYTKPVCVLTANVLIAYRMFWNHFQVIWHNPSNFEVEIIQLIHTLGTHIHYLYYLVVQGFAYLNVLNMLDLFVVTLFLSPQCKNIVL